MVAAADRSPARYIFELKLAEVPSGPLNSELEMLRPRQGHISSAIARAAVRFPTSAVVAFRAVDWFRRACAPGPRGWPRPGQWHLPRHLPRACAAGQEGDACAGRLPGRPGESPTRCPL